MASSLTLTNLLDKYPSGTTIGAFKQSNWATYQFPPSGAPVGSSDATASVSAYGAVTLTGLTDDTDFFLVQPSGGTYVYTRASTRITHEEVPDSSITTPDISPATRAVLEGAINVKDAAYGAVGGANQVTDAAITSGQATLSSTTAAFTATDVGKTVIVEGAGAAGVPLQTTVFSVAAGVATLAANAGTTVSAARATYGYDDTAAFSAAYATHQPLRVPQDKYLILGTFGDGTAVRMIGDGKQRSIIYRPSTASGKMCLPAGSLGSDINLSSNAAAGAITLTITSTTGLAAGDYLLLRSNADWNTTLAAGVRKGEVVRIQSVDSATQLTIIGGTLDAYATADTARVAKITYTVGNYVRGFTFVNATPDQGSNGRWFSFSLCARGDITDCEFIRGVDSQIALDSSRDIDVAQCDSIDGSRVGGAIPFGYLVQTVNYALDNNVADCRGLTGHGSIFTCSTASGAYGVSRFNTIKDCTAKLFHEMPFHTHEASEGNAFINCRALNGGYAATYAPVFGIFGKRHRVVNPDVQNCFGEAIRIDQSSDSAVVQGGVITNQNAGATRGAIGVQVRGPNATVKGVLIDGVHDAAASNNLQGAGITIEGTTGTYIHECAIKNTDSCSISHQDGTDSAIIENVLSANAGTYSIWASGGVTPAGKWRNIRTVNSTSGTTNKPAGLADQRQNPVAPGNLGPNDLLWNNAAQALTASRGYVVRFVPSRDMSVTAIAFALTVNAASNDTCDVAILDSAGTTLRSAGGAVAGKLNAGQGTWVSVNLSSAYVVRQGQIYYLALSVGTFGGAAAQVLTHTRADPTYSPQGTTYPLLDTGFKAGVGATIGGSILTPTAGGSVGPLLQAVGT